MRPLRDWLSPFLYFCDNWLSMIGVAVVTSSAILWMLLLPQTWRGEIENPYLGLLTYMLLPALFFGGLILIPLGIALKRRRENAAGGPTPSLVLGPFSWSNRSVRHLVTLVGLLTAANLVIGSQLTYSAIGYLDSTSFCGRACHTVMQPEYTAYQHAPHSHVECVKCHIGPGATGFVKAKVAGMRQLFGVVLQNYSKPVPAPVHNMHPAVDTCEGCHARQAIAGDVLKVIPKYAEDETNTATRTVLMLKLGGGASGGIHGAHLAPGVRIRFAYSDPKRQTIPWIEYSGPARQTIYSADGAAREPGNLPLREMDCMDCHNRPAHTYELPDRALDTELASGALDPSLPNVKKKGMELLRTVYATREEAASRIPAAFEKFYEQQYPDLYRERQQHVAAAGHRVLDIWNRNVFPDMKVTWGTYAVNIGHTDSPGCFRCHDGAHSSADGKSITQDCNTCHNVIATDETAPKVLQDLGMIAESAVHHEK